MAQYYFTAASLPMLTFEEKPFYSSDGFFELCTGEVREKDLARLAEALTYFELAQPVHWMSDALSRFDLRERGVRAALARLRAQRLGWELDEPEIEADVESEKIARDAISHDSPLGAEMIIQRSRWQYLEELSIRHYFDADMLVLYMLKLLVLERNEAMHREEGAERFNEIYSTMVQTLTQSERSE